MYIGKWTVVNIKDYYRVDFSVTNFTVLKFSQNNRTTLCEFLDFTVYFTYQLSSKIIYKYISVLYWCDIFLTVNRNNTNKQMCLYYPISGPCLMRKYINDKKYKSRQITLCNKRMITKDINEIEDYFDIVRSHINNNFWRG